MPAKRVIPCLDVTAGRVVKGVRFVDLKDAGDPAELAAAYDRAGADEIVFLDITASSDERAILLDVVARTADQVFIPLTVGGGVRSVEDAQALLSHGADKVSVNTAALADPWLISRGRSGSGRSAWCWPSTPGVGPGEAGRSSPMVADDQPAATLWSGPGRGSAWGLVRSCSPRWTGTAPGTATTSSCCGR